MDSTTLVTALSETQRKLGAEAAEALQLNDKLDVRAVLWWFKEETAQWQLLVSTPIVNIAGPRTAYTTIRKTLEKADLSEQLPIDQVWAVGEDSDIVAAIRRFTTTPDVAIINLVVSGVYIPGAYVLWIGKKKAKPRKRRKNK